LDAWLAEDDVLRQAGRQKMPKPPRIVFMTSNLGASEMQHAADGPIGFVNNVANRQENLTTIAMNAARKRFSPEFINRLDEILVFHPLPASQLRQVVAVEIERLESRLNRATGKDQSAPIIHGGGLLGRARNRQPLWREAPEASLGKISGLPILVPY
jgi:hypothetical protein